MPSYSRNEARISESVKDLLQSMERDSVPYAIWKNYDSLPILGRDLDIFSPSRYRPKYRDIIQAVAARNGWSAVTEEVDYTIGRNIFAEHFRLFDYSNGDCLEIDVMHRFEQFGIVVMKEAEVEASIIKRDWFYTTSPELEAILRLCQIPKIYLQVGKEVQFYIS